MRNNYFEKIKSNEQLEFLNMLGYNPFVETKKGNGRYTRKAINSYIFYYDIFALLSQIAFKWENMPLEIPNYQIEKCLFLHGSAGFSYDDVIKKYICLPAIKTGNGFDIYGEAKKYRLYSYTNSYRFDIENNENGFVCFNNALKKPNFYLAYRYACRLQMIDEIIDMNIDQQKTPYIIITDEKTKKTLESLMNKIELGDRLVYATKELDIEKAVTTLDLKVELKANDLIEAKREIFNEACMLLGISANLSNKKERLIESEVQTEEKRYDIYRQIGIAPRKYFCDKVNKKYKGLNLDVNYVLDAEELKEAEEIIAKATKTKRDNKLKDSKEE